MGTNPPVTVFSLRLRGYNFLFQDSEGSGAVAIVAQELQQDSYKLQGMTFAPGDVVLDIGGHVGMFSIWLARQYPFLRIVAYEPMPWNAANFRANLELNGIGNVTLVEQAVTADGRDLELVSHPGNSGAATASTNYVPADPAAFRYLTVPSVRFDEIFAAHGIARCRLLKIDCEGLEHEILLASQELGRIEAICGELHINRHLEARGYSHTRLQAHCAAFIPPEQSFFHCIRMSE